MSHTDPIIIVDSESEQEATDVDLVDEYDSDSDIFGTPGITTDDDDDIFGKLDVPPWLKPPGAEFALPVCHNHHHSPIPGTSTSGGDGSVEKMPDLTNCSLMTGVGCRDYSLLKEINVSGQGEETDTALLQLDSLTPHFQRKGLEYMHFATADSDRTLRETIVWLSPDELLAAVEDKLSKEGPRLAESGTLAPPTMLASVWSKPILPFVVGELADPVPTNNATWHTHIIDCSRHRGDNVMYKKASYPSSEKHLYRIKAPEIHASSLMAMVVSSQLDNASCCPLTKSCTIAHHIEDIVVNTATIYRDIMEDIGRMNSLPYIMKFVDTESFTYTTQVFVRGVYPRQTHTLSKSVHVPVTLIYPKVVVPSEGFVVSTAMRECFTLPSRGLVQISEISLVIECHGLRPCRYFRYQLDPLYERMGIVCVCGGDALRPSCICAQQYVDTLIRLSVQQEDNPPVDLPHPLAALHTASLPKSMSIIAYNMFVLIDELTRGNASHVERDTTMRGNNVTLRVEACTDKAAFISHDTKYSFAHQPSLFTEIHLSRDLLKTAQDVVNSVAQMCATVLFMMRFGNPNRTIDNDKKYNEIVKQITDFFPALDIKTLPAPKGRLRLKSKKRKLLTFPLTCDNCGGNMELVKKGYTSVLVCAECKSDTLKERFYRKLIIGEAGSLQKNPDKSHPRTPKEPDSIYLSSSESE
jgi:hypothetical protein